jgi:hypothetical protein
MRKNWKEKINASEKKEIKPPKSNLGIDLEEIDRIVFQSNKKKKMPTRDERQSLERNTPIDPYQDLKETQVNHKMMQMIDNSVDNSVLSGLVYQEEDSYINPSNISKVN